MTATPPRTYTTLSSRGLRHDTFPMRLYHKAKRLGIWNPRDIDLTQDHQDWQNISDEYKERLRNLIFGFQAGEEAVTLDLLPLIMTMAREGRLEEEMFLTTFLWEEAKHTEFFRRILDEVLESQDLHIERSTNNGRDLFGEDLPRTMNVLLTDPSPENQVRASVLYNMIIEGVLAETGYFSFSRMLNNTSATAMPGLRQGLLLIQRDESRHIAYGVFLISRLVAENKSLWPLVEGQMQELFTYVSNNQRENGSPEAVQAYSRQQFEKRLARIARARTQTLEQVYQVAASEEESA